MKRTDYLFFALLPLVLGFYSNVGAQMLLDKRIDLGRNEAAYALTKTQDGGYFLVGSINETGSAQSDVLVVKTNAIGDTTWTRVYPGTQSESASCVIQTSDGGYFVGGNVRVTVPNFPTQTDWILLRLSPTGDTLWTRTVRNPNNDLLFRLIKDGSGGVIAAGYRDIGGYAVGAYSRFSSGGELTQNSNFTTVTAIIQDGFLDDVGQLTLIGSRFSQTHDFAFYTFPSSGFNLFVKTLSIPTTAEYASRANQLADGSIIVSGARGFNLNMKPLLMKVNQNYDTIWTRTWSQFAAPTLSQTYGARSVVDNQNQVFMAFTDYESMDDFQGRLMVVSPEGDLIRSFLFGHPGNNTVEDLILNDQQQPVICGIAPQQVGLGSDAWLSVPDPDFVTSTRPKQTKSTSIIVHPNPSADFLYLPDAEVLESVQIWDNRGKEVNLRGKIHGNKVDLRQLPDGMYQLKVRSDQGQAQSRFLKQGHRN